jgi:hypothetical protein
MTTLYKYNIKTISHQLIPIAVTSPAEAWKLAMEYGDELQDIEFIGMSESNEENQE